MLPDCYHPSLREPDSNGRPPGYEPDELPTALPRDVIICECKGKAIFLIRQIFSQKRCLTRWKKEKLGTISTNLRIFNTWKLHKSTEMCYLCNRNGSSKDQNKVSGRGTPVVRQERIGEHHNERHCPDFGQRPAYTLYLFQEQRGNLLGCHRRRNRAHQRTN